MRGSICQTKLVSAFDEMEDLVKNFSSSLFGSGSVLMTLAYGSKWGSLPLHRRIAVKYGRLGRLELWRWIYG